LWQNALQNSAFKPQNERKTTPKSPKIEFFRYEKAGKFQIYHPKAELSSKLFLKLLKK